MNTCPQTTWCQLTDYEKNYIIEALRRDMKNEKDLALTDKAWSEFHSVNSRRSLSLLQLLNPKHTSAEWEIKKKESSKTVKITLKS